MSGLFLGIKLETKIARGARGRVATGEGCSVDCRLTAYWGVNPFGWAYQPGRD